MVAIFLSADCPQTPFTDTLACPLQNPCREGANVAVLRSPGLGLCLLLIPSAAEILGFPTNVSQCEQSVRVPQTLAKSLGR